jgi:predicted acylesterase/phospholipase RssA
MNSITNSSSEMNVPIQSTTEKALNIHEEEIIPEKKIRHLVISGGGTSGLSFYGILRESERMKKWSIRDIQSIYGTSVGSIFAVILSLKYDWDIIDAFILKRPWMNVFKFDIYSIMNAFGNRGILSIKVMEDLFSPLLLGVDLHVNTTLKELFDFNGIEIHIFSTEINHFELVNFSYKTHPNWRVVDVVYASCALPIIFSPFICNNRCYVDGGILTNYPLFYCLESGVDPDEILGIKKNEIVVSSSTMNSNENELVYSSPLSEIDTSSSLFDYLILTISKILEKLRFIDNSCIIKNEIVLKGTLVTIKSLMHTASSMEERKRLIDEGVDIFKYWNNNGNSRNFESMT